MRNKMATKEGPHCVKGEECNCGEHTEKAITRLFYNRYSSDFLEVGGELVRGVITLFFIHLTTGERLAAQLCQDRNELYVESKGIDFLSKNEIERQVKDDKTFYCLVHQLMIILHLSEKNIVDEFGIKEAEVGAWQVQVGAPESLERKIHIIVQLQLQYSREEIRRQFYQCYSRNFEEFEEYHDEHSIYYSVFLRFRNRIDNSVLSARLNKKSKLLSVILGS